MILDNFVDKLIGQKVLEENARREAEHKSSGKLSASMLGQPLQWQILKVLGVPAKEIDEYTLRKFLRGRQIEEWVLAEIPNKVSIQEFVEYQNTVGYVDAMIDTRAWDKNYGVIPIEVKSVSNLKFKRILKEGADRGHKYQATLYALAKNTEYYAVMYVSTDDLRVHTLVYPTNDTQEEVDRIIFTFHTQWAKKEIPVFRHVEEWQKNPQYQNYPDWANLTKEELLIKSQELFKEK